MISIGTAIETPPPESFTLAICQKHNAIEYWAVVFYSYNLTYISSYTSDGTLYEDEKLNMINWK